VNGTLFTALAEVGWRESVWSGLTLVFVLKREKLKSKLNFKSITENSVFIIIG